MYEYVKSGDEIVLDPSTPDSPSKLIIGTTPSIQLVDGRIVSVWRSGDQLYAQYLDAGGNELGTPFVFADFSDEPDHMMISAQPLPNGSFAVTWYDHVTGSLNARIFDESGDPTTETVQVNEDLEGKILSPTLTLLDDGGFMVLWTAGPDGAISQSDYERIHVRLYNSDGTPRTEEILVSQKTGDGNGQWFPSATELANGGFAVAWAERFENTFQIRIKILNQDGDTAVPEFGFGRWFVGNRADHPDILALENGGFVVAWEEDLGFYTRTSARVFAADGSSVSLNINVSGDNTSFDPPSATKLTALESGGFAVVWSAGRNVEFPYHSNTFVRIFDELGRPLGDSINLGDNTNEEQILPEIVSLRGGGFLVTWKENTADGTWAVKAQLFRVDGQPDALPEHYVVQQDEILHVDAEDGVLGNDEQPRNYDLTSRVAAMPRHGSLYVNKDGSLIYVPDEGFVGTDSFRYVASNGTYESDKVTVTISVAERDDVDLPVLLGSDDPETLTAPDDRGWRLEALAGDDEIIGGGGDDLLVGGLGDDTLTVQNVGDQVLELAGEGHDVVEAFVDFVLAAEVEEGWLLGDAVAMTGNVGDNDLHGNAHDNNLEGREGDDVLMGAGGSDRLVGDDGNDVLDAGDGSDALRGGEGGDSLVGGEGQDFMRGGGGADHFVFERLGDFSSALRDTAADRILDFQISGGDVIDLSAIDAVEGGGDDAFTFTGGADFSGTGSSGIAGELCYATKLRTFIYGDIDGDRVADFVIRLDEAVPFLTADDFVL